jgi:hypothetical protein
MATKERYSRVTADASVWSEHDPRGSEYPSDPEEGRRLLRAFLSIRQAAVREAIVSFVTVAAKSYDTRH